jgi:AcrR family transcriptional regulator
MALGFIEIIEELAAEAVTLRAILKTEEDLVPDWRERLARMLPRGLASVRAQNEPIRLLCARWRDGETAESLVAEVSRRLIESAENPPPAED